jgi:hypothetical protein
MCRLADRERFCSETSTGGFLWAEGCLPYALNGSLIWIDQFRRAVGRFHLSPGQAGDKRDDDSAYVPGLASVPFVTQRVIRPGMTSGWRAMVFSEVVETAQSRVRTGRTLLTL